MHGLRAARSFQRGVLYRLRTARATVVQLKLAPSVPCAEGDAGAVVKIRALISLGPEDDPHGKIIEDVAYCVNPHGIGSASTWSFPDPSETLRSSVLIRIDAGQDIGRNGDTYYYHYEWKS